MMQPYTLFLIQRLKLYMIKVWRILIKSLNNSRNVLFSQYIYIYMHRENDMLNDISCFTGHRDGRKWYAKDAFHAGDATGYRAMYSYVAFKNKYLEQLFPTVHSRF